MFVRRDGTRGFIFNQVDLLEFLWLFWPDLHPWLFLNYWRRSSCLFFLNIRCLWLFIIRALSGLSAIHFARSPFPRAFKVSLSFLWRTTEEIGAINLHNPCKCFRKCWQWNSALSFWAPHPDVESVPRSRATPGNSPSWHVCAKTGMPHTNLQTPQEEFEAEHLA